VLHVFIFLCKIVLNENATLSNLSYIPGLNEIYDAVVYKNLFEGEEDVNEMVVLVRGPRVQTHLLCLDSLSIMEK